MESTAELSRQDFNAEKIINCNEGTSSSSSEWKKSSPLKTYSKKSSPNSEKADGKSRYGRSHKPRLSGDFLSTDKKVSQYLKIDIDNQMHYFKASPYNVQKSPLKPIIPGAPRGRGRPPKALSQIPVVDGKYQALNDAFDRVIASSNDLQAPPPTSTETVEVPLMLAVPKEESQSDSEEVINENDWNAGDLAWACVGGYPYWPCALTKEPELHIFRKMKMFGKGKQPREFFHVRFFGDKGRRSWIVASNVIPFHGLDSFQSLAEETCNTPSIKKKDPKTYKAFTIPPSVRKTWQAAVSEAESLREAPRQERVQYFINMFPPTPLETIIKVEEKPTPKKRGRKSKAELAALAAAKGSLSPFQETKKIKLEPQSPTLSPKSPARQPRYTEMHIKKVVSPPRRVCRTPSPTDMKIKLESVTPTRYKTPAPSPFKAPVSTSLKSPNALSPKPTASTSDISSGPTPPSETPKKKRGRPLGSTKKKSIPEDADFVPVKRKYVKKSSLEGQAQKNKPKKKTGEGNYGSKKITNDKKFRDPAFETFYDKHFDRVSAENPTLSNEDIEKFIDKMWREVKDLKPLGFRSRDNAENVSNDSGNDSKSETSSRSDSPPPIILPSSKTPYRRGISLFSGVKSEKVCQVCLKNGEGGEVLKCRGPCGLPFHLDCSEKERFEIKLEPEEEVNTVKRKRGRPRSVNPLPSPVKSESQSIEIEQPGHQAIMSPPVPAGLPAMPVNPDGTPMKRKRGRPPKNSFWSPPKSSASIQLGTPNFLVKKAPDQQPNDIIPAESQDDDFIGFTEESAECIKRIVAFLQCYKESYKKFNNMPHSTEFSFIDANCNKFKIKECNIEPSVNETIQNSVPSTEKVVVNQGPTEEIVNHVSTQVVNFDSQIKETPITHEINSFTQIADNEVSVDNNQCETNKLLEAVRGDSFESEISNNNLIVDDSSTEDRLMIEESPSHEECPETKSAVMSIMNSEEDSFFSNTVSQTGETESISCINETDNNVRKISLDMPVLDFSESEDTMPPTICDKPKIESMPVLPDQVNHVVSSNSPINNAIDSQENTQFPTSNFSLSNISSLKSITSSTLVDDKSQNEVSSSLPDQINNVSTSNNCSVTSSLTDQKSDPMDQSSIDHNESFFHPKELQLTENLKSVSTNNLLPTSSDMSVSTSEACPETTACDTTKIKLENENSLDSENCSNSFPLAVTAGGDSSSADNSSNFLEVKREENAHIYSNISRRKSLDASAVLNKDEENSSKTSDSESDKAKNVKWMCSICANGKLGPCFVCSKNDDDAEKLRCGYCNKAYHDKCAQLWPQGQKSISAKGRVLYHCPQHTCHTCASDNPSCISTRFANDKLVRCVRCPATYHYGNYCIPAGSELLSISQILCPKHYKPHKKAVHHVSASWCMLCANGGSLICCELCPNSFHLRCLNLTEAPQGSFYCEDCETGRFPLFGEIVWVKLGTYRWWPARILFPQEIPDNILLLPHLLGEFAVEFFGSHDYYWVNRGRCFLYHEGDGCSQNVSKSRTDELFMKGVEESKVAFAKWTEERANREATTRPTMKPPKYQKILSNRMIGNVSKYIDSNNKCLAQTCDCDPKKPNPCGPDSDCINRLLSVECDPEVCPARENCCNRHFERRCYPRLVPFKTETRGWGLKTLDPLPKGSFIIEYVGEMIDEEEYQKRLAVMQKNKDENFYFLTIDKDRMLDAGPKGNVSRFMNHSCVPNCETQKWTVNGDTRVGLFTLENIQPDTELVFNYNLETIGNNKVECKCGAPNCSGFIGVKNNNKQNNRHSKSQTSTGEEKKVKKKKRKSKAKHTEDSCFTCGNGGELLLCDDASCPKAYHLSCLGLTKHPAGGWVCPWHQCSVCSATKVQRCTLCINSYCAEHAEGNISLNRTHGLLCFSHNPSDSGSDWSDDRGVLSDEEESTSKKQTAKKNPKAKIVNGHVD